MEVHDCYVYKIIDTPVGPIHLITSEKGLSGVVWADKDYIRTKLPAANYNEQAPILIQTELQLNEYFNKKRKAFDIPLDFRGTAFQIRVWKVLLGVPYGTTWTYGQLAQQLGDSKAVRAVGGALNKNPIAIIAPCHRIVGSSGKLVGFAGGIRNKSILLDLEQHDRSPTLFDL
jgi:methylated-DNA-[protein]-cysteine S-methyltransferase